MVDASNIITGLKAAGPWVQVGRNALPLFQRRPGRNAAADNLPSQHSAHGRHQFRHDILFPVLVRDLDALGVYRRSASAAAPVNTLKGPRLDIIRAINLNRPIPIEDGFTGDVITLDIAVDSSFPNGRRLGGGTAPNRHQVNVNTVLISLIAAGDPAAGLAKGVEVNDKDFLPRFPIPGPGPSGSAPGTRRNQHPDRTQHPDPLTNRGAGFGLPHFIKTYDPTIYPVSARRTLLAHDMWIEPASFCPTAGQMVAIKLRVGRTCSAIPFRAIRP
jgi:hypothetical protein